MTGTPVRILLARHGETVFNVEGRWQGQSDSPLTARGLAQARQLAAALADEPIAAVYSSDLRRAMATAHEVAAPRGLEVIGEARLREIHVGEWVGLNRAQILAGYGDMHHRWRYHPATLRLPGGETLAEAQGRGLAFVAERMPRHTGETIVIVTHGAIGQAILIEGAGRPVDDLWMKVRIDNCQISRLEWTAADGLRLIEISDVRHLENVGSLRGWRTTDADSGVGSGEWGVGAAPPRAGGPGESSAVGDTRTTSDATYPRFDPPTPHSPFLTPHSSLLTPHSSLPTPRRRRH
ncbi:MAG TPA: histidine phosphatase family protein [Chloroflexota bacterium]